MVTATCRVLVVDDEETILFAMQDYLAPQGYQVDTVRNAETAYALLTERTYSIAVVDLSLGPGQDRLGLELVRRLSDQYPATAIILFTAYATPEIDCEARRRGVVLLEKPLPLPALQTVIDRLASPKAPASADD